MVTPHRLRIDTPPLRRLNAQRAAWLLWVVFALLVAFEKLGDGPSPGNVFTVYRDAACHWWAGEALYQTDVDGYTGAGFIYLPPAAALLAPLALLPFALGGFVWRVLVLAVWALGVRRFAALVRPRAKSAFLWVSVPAIVMSWSAARHGQMTLVMGSAMLFAVAAMARRQWWRVGLWLGLGLAVKPLIIVLSLLVAARYPRTAWRIAAASAAALLLPFATQHAGYVWQQYQTAWPALTRAAEYGDEIKFAQVFWLLSSAGTEVGTAWATALRAAAALATLLLAFRLMRNHGPSARALLTYALSAGYLLLFNPRTENNTYCLLAPVLGALLAEAWARRQRGLLAADVALLLAFTLNHPLRAVTGDAHSAWLKPLLCAVCLVFVVWRGWCTTGVRRRA